MAKVKPDTKKILKAIDEFLPLRFYSTDEHVQVSGEDLILANHKEWCGEEIDKDKMYLMLMPAFYEVNHLRRMQQALKDKGFFGIFSYCREILPADEYEGLVQFLQKYKPYLA